MKIFCFIALFAAVMFSGCVSVDYVGQKLPEKDDVEYITIYPSMSEVPTEYKILGRGKVMTPQYYDLDKLDAILTEKAREVGAEAVAISSKKRVAVRSDNTFKTQSSRPSGSWNFGSTTLEGDNIYTDSFGKQQSLKTVSTKRYRVYYQIVFLTKQDITKKTPAEPEKK